LFNDRKILNLLDLIEFTKSIALPDGYAINCVVEDLDKLSFSAQLELFALADVFVTVAGTAAHNILFFRPTTALLMIMQPGWCDWSWIYVNQAAMLNMYSFVYCSEGAFSAVHYNHWTKNAWRQGPRLTKAANITVDLDIFDCLITEAVRSRMDPDYVLRQELRDNCFNTSKSVTIKK